jgi:hypothetical protein
MDTAMWPDLDSNTAGVVEQMLQREHACSYANLFAEVSLD